MTWDAASEVMIKVYKPNKTSDWSGLYWHGNGTIVPHDHPLCGWRQELCTKDKEDSKFHMTLLSVLGCVFVFIIIGVLIYVVKKYNYEVYLKAIQSHTVRWIDINPINENTSSADSVLMAADVTPHIGLVNEVSTMETVMYKRNLVYLKWLNISTVNLIDRNVLVEIQQLRDIFHENINSFIGICVEPGKVCILMTHEARGSLRDIISNSSIILTGDFKISFMLDIARGMWYLHQSSVGVHGSLTSKQCVIDGQWVCKITGHGLIYTSKSKYSDLSDENLENMLWYSPETLWNKVRTVNDIQKADVYSFGIIGQEVFTQSFPYSTNVPVLDVQDIIDNIKMGTDPVYRPVIPSQTCMDGWLDMIAFCWNEDPNCRPTFKRIIHTIKHIHKNKNLDLVDSMLSRLETHTQILEERVKDKSLEIHEEKTKVELILNELLPISVAQQLAKGHSVEPEIFENVTIFFSDIVGFTKISSEGTAYDTIVMLNDMYILFDDVTSQFDVYKVATIGDAYMVGSGVPIRNGNKHATEICQLSLALMQSVIMFTVPHLPNLTLELRVGIHTGPCVAGVAGLKMPRYLLFGDTVDIAAKMESGGEPMKIHISETTQQAIVHNTKVVISKDTEQEANEVITVEPSVMEKDRYFAVEERGEVSLKGMDTIKTFWLINS